MENQLFTEWHKDAPGTSFVIEETLYEGQSDFQKLGFYRTRDHGVLFNLDDMVMLCERLHHDYHEAIVHPGASRVTQLKNVLVVGGGDGGTALEMLKYDDVRITVCEIDGEVVAQSEKFIPQIARSFHHPSVTTKIEDAARFMAETSETFDLILVDSTDPGSIADPLFNLEFYKHVYDHLSDGGVVVAQSGSTGYDEDQIQRNLGFYRELFPAVARMDVSTAMYPGGAWNFTLGAKRENPTPVRTLEVALQSHGLRHVHGVLEPLKGTWV